MTFIDKISALRMPWQGEGPPRVAVVRLSGIIAPNGGPARKGLSLEAVAPVLERAFSLPKLSAVALVINSPGGSPVQSALIGRRIRALAKEKELPVIAFCEDVAASGGYWLACAADEIYADENSIVGSIGVVSAGFGFQEAISKLGVERRVHTSGEKKMLLDPFQAEKKEDVKRLEAIQEEVHDSFKIWVRVRRGARLKGEDKALFSGEFWTGRKALDLGLVDGLGDAKGELQRRYGEEVKLLVLGPPRRLFPSLFRMESGAPSGGFGLDGHELAEGLLSAAESRALWQRFGL